MPHATSSRSRRPALWGALVVALVVCAGCAGPSTPRPDAAASGGSALGIEPVRLALTAQNRMVDFRFRVVDPEKARLILSQRTWNIALVNQRDGRGVGVFQGIGKLGRLKQSTRAPEKGRVYSILFFNRGELQPGDRAVLRVETLEMRDLVVE